MVNVLTLQSQRRYFVALIEDVSSFNLVSSQGEPERSDLDLDRVLSIQARTDRGIARRRFRLRSVGIDLVCVSSAEFAMRSVGEAAAPLASRNAAG